jgi:DNA-binding winged helix-turn-helix (wHTH) protein/tetratricopeptide (TPR) repeat protein
MSSTKTGGVELDLGRYELRRAGRAVKLEKKPMELLILLVRRRDQLVSRDEIVSELWQSDLFVDTERNINNIVRKIRRALADDAARPRYLETVVGKGYRFVGPVRVVRPLHESPQNGAPARGARTLRQRGLRAGAANGWRAERPSLAVVPLRVSGGRKIGHSLALGLADALVARLAQLEGVDVLPVSATLNAPAGGDGTVAEVAARLGVRFLMHGTLESTAGETRASIQLFDAELRSRCFSRTFAIDPRVPFAQVDALAMETARILKRPLREPRQQSQSRFSPDPVAYAEFIQGYRDSSSGDPGLLEGSTRHLVNAVARDPEFALAHAVLSYVCAVRHYEFDPSRTWLEKAEFHCERALQLNADLPEGHVARAFLLWGPSKNFQHLEAIASLKHALALQNNLPHAYNRLGTILAHVGLLDHARTMYENGQALHPAKAMSHSIAQVYLWSGEFAAASKELQRWREENPANKYALYFAPQPALLGGDWKEARALLDEAVRCMPDEPLILSLEGVLFAATGEREKAMRAVDRACTNPKSFGHAHHTYYQIACILSLLGRPEVAFEWLERSVDTGFACWPFFLKDPGLAHLRRLPQFDLLVSSLQGRYADHLGLLPS